MAKAAVIEPRRTLLVHLVSLGLICSALNLSAQTNGVLREVFTGINGGSISDLTNSTKFPNSPDETYLESNFEAPSNFADYYGQRMRALLLPPVTGTYTFWLASDDGGALYLSTDESPARKVQIASESSWAGQRAWNDHASQKSVPLQLTNGFRYYIEALQKEGAGGDNLAVAWQKPGDAAVANGAPPIPGTYPGPLWGGATSDHRPTGQSSRCGRGSGCFFHSAGPKVWRQLPMVSRSHADWQRHQLRTDASVGRTR